MPERRRLDTRAVIELGRSPEWHTRAGQEQFRELYEREVGGERLFDADASDAWSFVGPYSWEAMTRRDYPVAECELRRFLAHPEVEAVEHHYLQDLWVRLALCALAQGRESEAIGSFREVMANDRQEDPRIVACMIRNGLGPDVRMWCLTKALKRRGLASEEMTGFVEELAARILRRPPRRRRFPRRTSYAKLHRLLWKTLGRPRYRRGYRSPEQVMSEAREGVEQALREIRAKRARKSSRN